MTERERITTEDVDPVAFPRVYNEPDTSGEKQMTAGDVQNEAFPDPDEPKGRQAGFTLLFIIGGIFLTMIVVMVIAFVYFQNYTEGPTTIVAPALASVAALVG